MPGRAPDGFIAMAKGVRNVGNSRSMDLLSRFYPYRELRTRDIPGDDGRYRIISRHAGNNLLEKAGDTSRGRRYRLTLHGRVRVMCRILGVPFLRMCILAEAYVVNSYQMERGTRQFYPAGDLIEPFRRIYAKKSIQNATSGMCSDGLAVSVGRQVIRLKGHTIGRLQGHDPVIRELHDLICGLPSEMAGAARDDPKVPG